MKCVCKLSSYFFLNMRHSNERYRSFVILKLFLSDLTWYHIHFSQFLAKSPSVNPSTALLHQCPQLFNCDLVTASRYREICLQCSFELAYLVKYYFTPTKEILSYRSLYSVSIYLSFASIY